MAKILGINVLGLFYDGGEWKPAMCARSVSITTTTEMIETSVSGSGRDRTVQPSKNSWSASFDGICALEMPGGLTIAELRQKQLAHERMQFRYERTDQDANIYTDEGFGYFTSITDSATFDDLDLYNGELVGTGSLIQSFTPTVNGNGKVKRYPLIGSTHPVAGGTTTITINGLGGKDILGVWKDGTGNNDIITSGSPVGKEVLYQTNASDATKGDFTWAIPFEDGENFFILYQDI